MSENDVPVSNQSDEELHAAPVHRSADGAQGYGGSRASQADDDEADDTSLEALDEQIERFTAQKRWSDVIKTIQLKAERVDSSAEKAELYAEAGRLYLERSPNQSEAIKCFAQVLEVDPSHREAITRLKEMYEKRRDWERLVEVRRSEVALMDPADQLDERVQIALLATERLRKPAICIELWQDVLSVDPIHDEALAALATLYERAREWEPLAQVLERQSEGPLDEASLVTLLTKLGSVYADKLGNDEGAISAYQRLLALRPDDRRAQEQLKKRFVSARAWDELEAFYEASDKWEEFIRTLERAAEAESATDEDKVDLQFRVARTWLTKRDKADRAARAYEKILAVDETHQEAAEALAPIYAAAGDAKKLVAVNQVRLQHIQDPVARVELLRECALLHLERLRSPAKAFECLLDAFATDPTDEGVREQLAELVEKVPAERERLFEAYKQAIDDAGHPDDAHDLRLQYGGLLQQAGELEQAIATLAAVSADRPDDMAALAALSELYEQTGQFEGLQRVLQRRSELAYEPQERRELAYALAELQRDRLQDPEAAINAYRAICEEFGQEEVQALEALEALYTEQARFSELAELLQTRIDLQPTSDSVLLDLKFRLATLCVERLQQPERAVGLAQEILTLAGEHPPTVALLERLLADSELGGQAASILEPLYEQGANWAKLVEVLRVGSQFVADEAEQVEALIRIAELQLQQLGDGAAAFESYSKALRLNPERQDIAERLEELALSSSRVEDLVRLLKDLAITAPQAELRRALRLAAARLQEEELEDVDGAVASYTLALDEDPDDGLVLQQLELLYRRTERWHPLMQVLRQRAGLSADPAEQEELLVQVAFILYEMLGDAEQAIAVYGEVLEINPLSLNALGQLDRLYEAQQMWGELADNVARQLSVAEDEARQVTLMLKLAQLRESRMDQVPGAIEIYREVLVSDPSQSDALSALQRLLERPEYQQTVADILEPIYSEAGEYARLVGVYEIQLTHSASVSQRVELLHRMAELHESVLQDLNSAFDCQARALAEEPADARTQAELERLAATLDQWEALAQVYEQRAPGIDDTMLASSLYFKAAEIRETQLGDPNTAVQHFRKVLELDSRNVEAASALERLYQGQENYEDLANVYLAKASMMEVPDSKREQLFRAAAIYEEILGRPEQAIAVYERSLAVEPDDMAALDRLIELHSRQSNWDELLAAYEQKADATFDPDEKRDLFLQIGQVYEQHTQQPEKAIEVYQRILELDPTEAVAISRLDALYVQSGQWDQLLSILEREAENAQDPAEALGFRYRIGELYEHRLSDPYGAVEVYREVLAAWPEHGPSRAALERMIAEGREPMAAATVLEPIYRANGEAEPLISVLEVLLSHDEDPVRRVELLHQIAELHEVHVGQAAAAFDAYARALAYDSEDERLLSALERLAEGLGAYERLAAIYDAQVEAKVAEQPEVALELALRLAKVFEVRIGDIDNAIARYQVVVEHEPNHEEALSALDRLFEASERWQELVPVLQREIETASDPDQLLAMQFRLGRVLQEHLGDLERAVGLYREVLLGAPEHEGAQAALEELLTSGQQVAPAAEVLEPLYRSQENWPKLIQLADLQLPTVVGAGQRVLVIRSVVEIAEDQLQDPALACQWALRAVLEDPSDPQAFEDAERLAERVGDFIPVADAYARAAEVCQADGSLRDAAGIGCRLAELYERRLDDVPRAEEAYRYVVSLVPSDTDALTALDRIYTQHGAGEALATVLRARISAAVDDFDRIDLSHRLAEVLYNEVGRTSEAIAVLTHILDNLDAEHEPSLRSLQNIYTATKDWRALYHSYERELKVAFGDTDRSEILGRMAHLAAVELGEPDKAVELLRQVLELLGEEPAALNALGNLYALHENWTDLVDVLEREVAVTVEDAQRVAIYSDLGRIWYEKLQRDKNALESWERVLDIDPANTEALLAIASVHRQAGSPSELVDALHRLLDVAAERAEVGQLEAVHMELGELYAQRLASPHEAVEHYRRVLEIAPRNFAAMDALEAIFAAQEEWSECIEVLHGRADAFEEPAARIQVLLQIARLWEDKLEEPDGARRAYDQILQLEPEHELAFSRLEALHRDAERFDELIELYIVRVETSEDVRQRIELLHKMAEVYERDRQDKNQAFDAVLLAWQQDFAHEPSADAVERLAGLTQRWNEVLDTANGALQTLRDSGAEASDAQTAICLRCARWYAREGHPDYAIPYLKQVLKVDPLNRGAMLQMADLQRQTEQWQPYLQLLGRLAEMTEDAHEKADVLVRMGAVHDEQFAAPTQAVGHYRDALAAVPGHEQAIIALEGIYRREEQWPELVDILKRRIDALDDPSKRLATMVDLAEVYEERLDDTEQAIACYRRVVDEDPLHMAALKGLERLYTRLERWPELLEILESELATAAHQRDQVELLQRIAGMWEDEFLKLDRASDRLEEVLEIDPLHKDALSSLARLYRAQRRWEDLIRIYERHIDIAESSSERAEVYGAIGAVCREQLKDVDRAVDAYLNVIENDSESAEALSALAALYEEREDYSMALDTMERLAAVQDDSEARVELFCKMGELYSQRLEDQQQAIEYFQRATDLDAGHLRSLLAMRDIHMEQGEYHAVARVLERAVAAEDSDRRKAALRIELGRLYDVHLKEHDAAIEAFENARALDPDNVDAALPLVDEYINADRYADAEPLLQMLVRSGSRFSDGELQRLWSLYGECAEKLDNMSVAVRAFGEALALDAGDLTALRGLARAHYQQQDWDEAFKYYQMLLVHHRDALGFDDTTDAFFRLGVIKRALGEQRKALNMFEKALEEDPGHRPTLDAMVDLHAEVEEWEQVIRFKKRILDNTEDPQERFALFSEIGALWQDRLNNPATAIEAFVEAAELQPEDHKMLHKLLGLYLKTAQWESVIDIINRISAVDEREQVRAKNAYTIGVILRDELKDPSGALQHFNEALDLDPLNQLKAFEAINKVLTQQKNWKELERAFRKMLRRVSGQGDPELEFNLWHNLGVIYRDRLRDMVAAVEAFGMASRLQPKNMQEHQILAEIYAVIPGRTDQAIAEHQTLLRNDPNDARAYRALYKLYFDARAYDKAWCVAATLNYLQQADTEHQQFYQQYKLDGPIRPRSRLTDELWVKELYHPEENFLVGKIFESVTPAMLQWHRVPDKRLDLKKKQEVVDLANTTIAFARTFGFVNQVFGLGFTPRLFVCPDRAMGLEYATTIPPASVCGSSLLSGVSPLDVIFIVGRHLAFYRPEHYIRTILQTKDQLKLVLAAAMRIAGADIPDAAVGNTANELQAQGRMQPAQAELLKKISKRFADAGARADMKAWMRSTELTAARAGFLMCNDLGIASRMVQSLPPLGAVELSPRERIQDLVLFSVSESYFRLREALGIAISVV